MKIKKKFYRRKKNETSEAKPESLFQGGEEYLPLSGLKETVSETGLGVNKNTLSTESLQDRSGGGAVPVSGLLKQQEGGSDDSPGFFSKLKRERRIPTLVGLFLVLSLVVVLFFIGGRRVFWFRAQEAVAPSEVRTTNVTDNSFTASWFTSRETTGLVQVLDDKYQRLFSDFRTEISGKDRFTTHYIIVEGLESGKEYRFMILSGGVQFGESAGQPYKVKTASAFFGELPIANLASGVVKNFDGEIAEGAIVYLKAENFAPLSSLVTNQGNWAVSLAKAFSEDLTRLADQQDDFSVEEIFVQGVLGGTATALVYAKDDDPVPEIILGNDYDFTQESFAGPSDSIKQTAASAGASRLGEIVGFTGNRPFEIINPEDGEMLHFFRPEIFGTGPSGGIVKITLESEALYQAELTIDESGDWRWSPPDNLDPGEHKLTVTHIDPLSGAEETFIRTFILAAEMTDDNPSFSATPSGGTVTPTLLPTDTPVPTPTPEPTATPTLEPTPAVEISPTLSSTLSPTLTPTATPTAEVTLPSTESGVPETGFFGPTLFVIVGGAVLFLTVLAQLI
ncbi:MAG: fibronectin type III domain-containing protein [Patescibacteria group bacterium]|nr:fibronectin type III domain-containing protein [Patescibacteria group bacterium]